MVCLRFNSGKEVALYYPLPAVMIEFLILAMVQREDSYGYEISQRLKCIANLKEATLYPILKKLVDSGFLTTYQQEYQGRTRKYYQITPSGNEQLVFLSLEWEEYKKGIDNIWKGEVE